MKLSGLYLLTPPAGDFLDLLPKLIESGIDLLQYRRPQLPDRTQLVELKKTREITAHYGIPLFVNDRPDLACLSSADGVHLGAGDIPTQMVKNHWPRLIVGLTVRAEDPLEEWADYFSVGPVFEPVSKTLEISPCGWSPVEQLLSRANKPLFAIGGITSDSLNGELPAGLAGVAICSAVWNADSPCRVVKNLKRALNC